ncbi:MAG: OmpH/Skp family outer membrane protein [Planctomycetota bacterium]
MGIGLLLSGLAAQGGENKARPPKSPPKEPAKGARTQDAAAANKKKAPKRRSLHIVVVDVDRATSSHPQFQAKTEAHSEWRRAQSVRLDKMQKDIQSKEAELNNTVKPGTEAAERLVTDIKTLRYRLNLEGQRLNELEAAKRAKLVLELQAQVLDAVAELAPKRGIDLVLRRRAHRVRAPLSEQARRSESTDVLYAAASLDITDDVIDFLKTKHPAK